ncbi:hypothetical protein PVAP13_2KG533366 [Panicum virgatum]|uniref:Uncharacterized protein n=1 Tax=Panicum virgatum TaxID=38727 RepID=A0A8T0WHT5_PANVG|nr:hypothetical protein PVAP13_2KG533366 [Panicum virgatum]
MSSAAPRDSQRRPVPPHEPWWRLMPRPALPSAPGRRAGSGSPPWPTLAAEKESMAADQPRRRISHRTQSPWEEGGQRVSPGGESARGPAASRHRAIGCPPGRRVLGGGGL